MACEQREAEMDRETEKQRQVCIGLREEKEERATMEGMACEQRVDVKMRCCRDEVMACEKRKRKRKSSRGGDGLGEFLGELTEQSGQDRKDALRSGRRAAVGAMMAFDARDLDVLRRASCG